VKVVVESPTAISTSTVATDAAGAFAAALMTDALRGESDGPIDVTIVAESAAARSAAVRVRLAVGPPA
jgi:hypothetical protein